MSFRFQVDAERSLPVAGLRCLRSLSVSPVKRSRLQASYWDTANLAVRGRNAAIEISRVDSGAWIERIYARGPDGELRVCRRLVLKVSVPSAKTLQGLSERESLQPLVVRRVARASRLIRGGDRTLIGLTTERGTWTVASARDTHKPIFDLELVLIRGAKHRFMEVAQGLVAELPLRVSGSNLVDRAYDLVGARGGATGQDWTLVCDASTSLERLVQLAALECVSHMEHNVEGAREHDDEALHQLRVGLRRYRTVFAIDIASRRNPQSRAIEKQLKWLWGELGVVRDLDVLARETWPAVVSHAQCGVDMSDVARAIASMRDRRWVQLRRTLDGKRFQRLMLAMHGFEVDHPADASKEEGARGAAHQVLAAQVDRFARHGKHVARASVKRLHRLRIATKKLRYLTEFFVPLFTIVEASRPYLARLAALQTALGEFNDLSAGERLLKAIAPQLKPSTAKRAHSLYRRYARARREKLRERIVRGVRKVRRTAPSWL